MPYVVKEKGPQNVQRVRHSERKTRTSSWVKMAARRSGRGKKGLAIKHTQSEAGRRKHPSGNWLQQQRRGGKGYS